MNWAPRVLKITVPVAGTPVVGLAAGFSGNAQVSPKCIIAGLASNTSDVYYGGSDIDATHRRTLAPAQADEITAPGGGQASFIDLSTIRFDAAVNGEGFEITYFVTTG